MMKAITHLRDKEHGKHVHKPGLKEENKAQVQKENGDPEW